MRFYSILLKVAAIMCFSASTMAQVPNYVPTNGLVGWWPFNGNTNDESGSGNNGTVNGATLTQDRFGNTNKAYSFDGDNDYIEVPHSNSLNISGNISLSVWINPATLSSRRIIDKTTIGTSDAYMIDLYEIPGPSSDRIRCIVGTPPMTPQPQSLPFGLTINQYFHVVVTYDQSVVQFYIDGILNNTFIETGLSGNNTNPLRFAANSILSGNWFHGTMDDIGIWNRVLTQQEITDLYNAVNCSNNTTINPQTNSLVTGGIGNFTATTSDPNPSYVWQSNFGQGFQTLNDIENYSGTNTASLNIANVQLSEHLQPIRVITTSGECVDTSDIATISILDTCVTSINDTTFITVTDTLVINTLITGTNPPNNSNTIKVYPNPANSHITIEYGDFEIMNGYQLRIENSLGQEVFQTSITQESDYLDLNSWGGNGLYFVHIVDPQGNTIDIRKIVLQ
jgi:hypothetical protein